MHRIFNIKHQLIYKIFPLEISFLKFSYFHNLKIQIHLTCQVQY